MVFHQSGIGGALPSRAEAAGDFCGWQYEEFIICQVNLMNHGYMMMIMVI